MLSNSSLSACSDILMSQMNATSDANSELMQAMKMRLADSPASHWSSAVTNSVMMSADASSALSAARVMLKRIIRARR